MDANQVNVAAAASIARDIANRSVKAAKCRDCGTDMVAWVQSKKTGKWYLADATLGTPGKRLPASHLPHFKSCQSRKG